MQPFGCNSSSLLDLISLFGVRDGHSMSSYNGVMTYNMAEEIPRMVNGRSFCHWTYCVYLVMNIVQPDVYNYNVVNHPSHYHYTFNPNFFI